MPRKQMNLTHFSTSPQNATHAAIVLALFGTGLLASCSHDWTAYDPRVDTSGSSSSTGSSSSSNSSSGVGGESGSSSSGMAGAGGMGGEGGSGGGMGGAGGGPTCVPDTGKACYTGPQGTINIGICKGGATLCQPDGMTYGPCLGEVVPKVEECSTTSVDDDCNGQINEHCGIWAIKAGTTLLQRINDVTTDIAGNVYVTGIMFDTADFGGGVLTSAGGSDIFAAKFDKDGKHLWSLAFGGPLDDVGTAIALDAAGNSYITGSFMGMMKLGIDTLTAVDMRDSFIVSIGPDGTSNGYLLIGGMGEEVGNDIAVGGDGGIIVTGGFTTEINTGMSTLTSTNLFDGFIVKYDMNGTFLWHKSFGGTGDDEGISVTTNGANQVHLTGNFDETVDFGGGVIVDGGSADVFLAKLDSNGNHLLSKGFPSDGDQFVDTIAVDAASNIFLLGDFTTAANFGGGSTPAIGGEEIFLTKLDPMGGHIFTKTYGDSGNQYGRALAIDSGGNIVFTVGHEGVVDYGGGPITNAGASSSSDVVVVKLTNSGNFDWSRRFGSSGDQDSRALAIDSMNNILVGGDFAGSINVGVTTINVNSGDDAFLFKLPP